MKFFILHTPRVPMRGRLFKTLLIMKLTIAIMIIACLHVSASGLAQKITLNEQDASLKEIFKQIRAQSGYIFFYENSTLKGTAPVSIRVKDAGLQEVLDLCFKGQPLAYTISGNTIGIRRKEVITQKDFLVVPIVPKQMVIHGHVTDSAGHPMQGVSVIGNREGKFKSVTLTVTNAKGEFEIEAQKGDNITFSYIGYKSHTVIIGNETELDITLLVQPRELDAFTANSVNTGYQKIKPEQSTGAVSSIGTKEYESRISTNFLDGLINKLPGLLINNNITFTQTALDGTTTTNPLFQIRGLSTISGNQSPLIVVDGYPTELTLDMIDPNEIKSVTVLKDAAAATVYGVRASNGVIVIERKQAVQGKPRIGFRTTFGFTPKENYSRYRWAPDASDLTIDYARAANSTLAPGTWSTILSQTIPATSGVYSPTAGPAYYIIAQQKAGLLTDDQAASLFASLGSYNNASDYSRLFLRTAATKTYNVDVSGGSPNALYYITANYTGNTLEQDKNSNNRLLLSGRSTLNFSRRFSLELTTEYLEKHATAAPIPNINSIYPYERLRNSYDNPLPVSNGSRINPYYNTYLMSLGFPDNLYYPLVDMNHISDKTHTVDNRITANFKYVIGSGFNLTFGGIYENSRTDTRHLADAQSSQARQYTGYFASPDASGKPVFNLPLGAFLQQQTASTSSYTVRAQLNYNKRIGKDHSLNAIIGAEVRDATTQSSSTAYFGYDDQTLIQQPVDYGTLFGPYYSSPYKLPFPTPSYTGLFRLGYTDSRFVSGYSNIVYSFRNKYSLTGSIRVDQSNLFGTNPKYRYKPLWSLGAAWNVNKEDFLREITWIGQLKLRLAYGFNGNVAANVLPQVIAKASSNLINPAVGNIPTLLLQSNANSALRWEQTKNLNLGLDYTIFKNISGSIDLYDKKSEDLLATGQIDASKGGSSALINAASIDNRGLEISLHADWINTPRLNWNTGLVFSYNKSKVLSVYNIQPFATTPSLAYVLANYLQGYPVGAMFTYRYAGLDSTGSPRIYGPDGKSYQFNTGVPATYLRYAGSSIPSRNLGLSNRIDIGNFYFYCMINYYGGFKVRVPVPSIRTARPLAGAGNYWQQPGDENKPGILPSISSTASLLAASFLTYFDTYTVNGDYFTLGDLTASYNIGNWRPLKKAGFTHFEIKLQASNVYTIALNKYNYSMATGSYTKPYVTPTYTVGLFTNF